MEAVLGEAHAVILERHLERAAPQDLALWSLRGLSAIDPRLLARIEGGELRVLAEDRTLAGTAIAPLAPAAPGAGGRAIAAGLAGLYEAAWTQSPALRRAGAERVLTAGFEELFNHLDPYSRYVPPAEARAARERRVGQSGLGLRVAVRRDALVLGAITPGGAAQAAGLRVGDRLLAVDGRPADPRDPSGTALRLEGPPDSSVSLRVSRAGRPRDVTLVRRLVVAQTVTARSRGGILWIAISSFGAGTEQRLAEVLLDSFAARPPRGVVLDLRGNRGGVLAGALAVADAFLESGEVARTEGRHPDANRRYSAGGRDLAEGRPLVVLIDGRTASAAEIAAAGLAERGRAALVGSASTGKGLIQLVAPLPNQSDLLVSWSRMVAPGGWPIQGLGVLPVLCTSLGPDALAQGLAALARGVSPMIPALRRQREARAPVLASEMAALRNACPPAEGRAADLLAAEALIDQPESYRAAVAASVAATPP